MNKKSFERPALSERGGESHDKVYMAVGRALSEWEHVESSLGNIFLQITNLHILVSHEIFGAIVSSSGRADVIKAAGDAYFMHFPVRKKRFKKLIDHVKRHSGMRNDIAHGMAIGTEQGCFLFPANYASKKGGGLLMPQEPLFKYSDADILDIAERFRKLDSMLWDVRYRIGRWTQKVDPELIPPLSAHKNRILLPTQPE